MITALGVEDLSIPTSCVKFYAEGDERCNRNEFSVNFWVTEKPILSTLDR